MRVNGHSEQSARQEMGKTALSHNNAAIVTNYLLKSATKLQRTLSGVIIRAYFQLNVSIVVTDTRKMFRRRKKDQ